VARGIVSVGKVGLGRQVTLKLDPVQALDIFLGVGFDEGVKFAIGDAVKDEAVGADVLGGFGEMNLYVGVVCGRDGGAGDLTVGSGLGSECQWED